MSKKFALLSVVLMAAGAVFMLFGRHDAEAKVCFVTDAAGNCGGMTISSTVPNGTQCTSLGYICQEEDCHDTRTEDLKSWITDNLGVEDPAEVNDIWRKLRCPLNNTFFRECPMAFKPACPSPYESNISCGNLKGCTCPSTHKYTQDLLTSYNPNNIKTNSTTTTPTNVLHCMGTGGACSDIDEMGNTDTDPMHQRYPACICTPPYIYSASDNTSAHAVPYKGNNGKEFCRDNNGVEHYMGWDCDDTWYNKTVTSCQPYGIDDSDKCFDYEDYAWRYHKCLNCDDYPAVDLKYVVTDLSIPNVAPHVSGCENTQDSECMKNNFEADGHRWVLKTTQTTEETLNGTVTYGPYTRYYTYTPSGMQRYWGEEQPKFSYITCPHSIGNNNIGNERYYIVDCTEPGMRPSTDQDLVYDGAGEPVMEDMIDPVTGSTVTDNNGNVVQVQKRYKNGEACVPVGCEDAVKFVLTSGFRIGDDQLKLKMSKYGILLSTPVHGYDRGVGSDDSYHEVEDYYFVDGNGDPIVEQYINTPNGGYLRTLISSSASLTPSVTSQSPSVNVGNGQGYGYYSNDEIPVDSDFNYRSIYTDADEIDAYGHVDQTTNRFTKRRKAIVIDDINFTMQGGVYKQPRQTCVRRPCVATVNGQKQYWGGGDLYGGSGNGAAQTPNMCRCKSGGTSSYQAVCASPYQQSSTHWSNNIRVCSKQFSDNLQLPYWSKSANPTLGNNSGSGHSACGDVQENNQDCVTCFAKGYLDFSPYRDTCGDPGMVQPNDPGTPVPTKANNCLASASEGPGNNTVLTFHPNGTLYGKYAMVVIDGFPPQYNNPNIVLQDWDSDPTCVETSIQGENSVERPVGLGGAPVDEYISVKEFYNDLDTILPSGHKELLRGMIERSCRINSTQYRKPKITFSGDTFPAKHTLYNGKVWMNNLSDGSTSYYKYPVMSFKGIDVDLTSTSATINRPFVLDDVDLTAKNLKIETVNMWTGWGINNEPVISSKLQNSSITAISLINKDALEISSSTIMVNSFENGEDNGFPVRADIVDTNIGLCTFDNKAPLTITSVNGSHMVAKPTTILQTSTKACTSVTLTITDEFISNKYKYELTNFTSDYGNATTAGSCGRVVFNGNNNNSVTDIVVSNTMSLQGTMYFDKMRINTKNLKIGLNGYISSLNNESSIPTASATIVNMAGGSKLTMTSGGVFEMSAPSLIGDAFTTNGVVHLVFPGGVERRSVHALVSTKTRGESYGLLGVLCDKIESNCFATSALLYNSPNYSCQTSVQNGSLASPVGTLCEHNFSTVLDTSLCGLNNINGFSIPDGRLLQYKTENGLNWYYKIKQGTYSTYQTVLGKPAMTTGIKTCTSSGCSYENLIGTYN